MVVWVFVVIGVQEAQRFLGSTTFGNAKTNYTKTQEGLLPCMIARTGFGDGRRGKRCKCLLPVRALTAPASTFHG